MKQKILAALDKQWRGVRGNDTWRIYRGKELSWRFKTKREMETLPRSDKRCTIGLR